MAKTVPITRFDGGMAEDYRNVGLGEFAYSSHFDILSFPKRLQPLRGMTIDVASSGIGNFLVASNGFTYGLGWKASNNAHSALWQRCSAAIGVGGYASGDLFKEMANGSNGNTVQYTTLLEWSESGDSRTLCFGNAAAIIRVDPTDVATAIVNTLTFSTMGQALVHPTDKVMYIPYQATAGGAPLIGTLAPGVAGGAVTTAALTLAIGYRAYCLSHYGNYLAIPCTGKNNSYASVVYLWDRVATTWNETIVWGAGDLRVLNNLDGVLVGVSHRSSGVSGTTQDSDGVEIKMYSGGVPVLIKEINQNTLGVGNVSMTVNSNVNFIKNGRLYFSIDIIPNDGSTTRKGLWSVGKSKTGRWVVTCERVENNTSLSILAASMQGDFVSVVSNAVGTVYSTTFGTTGPSTYGATSIYESGVNPNMDELDRAKNKKLISWYVNVMPIVGGTLTVKYKVDDTTQGGNWVACGTYSTTAGTTLEIRKPTTGQFKDGKYFEFQISATGGVAINDWGYEYMPLKIKK